MNTDLTLRIDICFLTIAFLTALNTFAVSEESPARPRHVLCNFDGDPCIFTKAGSKEPVAITVEARKLLSFDSLPCDRIAIGEPDDYKPCVARLPDSELLLSCFHQYPREDNKVLEQTLLFRSTDRGRTWQTIRVESEGINPKASNHTTRNVLEMSDGTLVTSYSYRGEDEKTHVEVARWYLPPQ